MASFKKTESGKWQAQIARAGFRKAKSSKSKREAQDWAARQEYLIENPVDRRTGLTVEDLFLRYARDESPKRKGGRWEIFRLQKLCRDPMAKRPVELVTPADIAGWRDRLFH